MLWFNPSATFSTLGAHAAAQNPCDGIQSIAPPWPPCSSSRLSRHGPRRCRASSAFRCVSPRLRRFRATLASCASCAREDAQLHRGGSALSQPAPPSPHATIACLRTCAARRRVQRVGGRRIRRRPIRHDGVVLALACRCRRQPRSRVRVPINPRRARLQPAHATLRRCRHCPSHTRRLPQRRDRLGVG